MSLKPGDPVAIKGIAALHAVSKQTAAKALRVLADDGLLQLNYDGPRYVVSVGWCPTCIARGRVLRAGGSSFSYVPCPTCEGTGRSRATKLKEVIP